LTRLNITLSEEILTELSREVEPRKRSRFIRDAVARSLKEIRERRLAREYEEASSEIRRIDNELEGVIGDGLD
jgi:metal-responsive CopG/Arc/MetJ family transcriptional regulator